MLTAPEVQLVEESVAILASLQRRLGRLEGLLRDWLDDAAARRDEILRDQLPGPVLRLVPSADDDA